MGINLITAGNMRIMPSFSRKYIIIWYHTFWSFRNISGNIN